MPTKHKVFQDFIHSHLYSLRWNDPERDTECAICHEPYDKSMHTPVRVTGITGCNHTFGLNCVNNWVSTKGPSCNTCPMCRTEWFVLDERPAPYVNSMAPRRILATRRCRQNAMAGAQQSESSSTVPTEDAARVSGNPEHAAASPRPRENNPPLRLGNTGSSRPGITRSNGQEEQTETVEEIPPAENAPSSRERATNPPPHSNDPGPSRPTYSSTNNQDTQTATGEDDAANDVVLMPLRLLETLILRQGNTSTTSIQDAPLSNLLGDDTGSIGYSLSNTDLRIQIRESSIRSKEAALNRRARELDAREDALKLKEVEARMRETDLNTREEIWGQNWADK